MATCVACWCAPSHVGLGPAARMTDWMSESKCPLWGHLAITVPSPRADNFPVIIPVAHMSTLPGQGLQLWTLVVPKPFDSFTSEPDGFPSC